MIKNVDDFKNKVYKWLDDSWAMAGTTEEENEIRELQRIVELVNCDVIWKLDGVCSFESEIDLNKIINILSQGGKIKKLSEVNFDE